MTSSRRRAGNVQPSHHVQRRNAYTYTAQPYQSLMCMFELWHGLCAMYVAQPNKACLVPSQQNRVAEPEHGQPRSRCRANTGLRSRRKHWRTHSSISDEIHDVPVCRRHERSAACHCASPSDSLCAAWRGPLTSSEHTAEAFAFRLLAEETARARSDLAAIVTERSAAHLLFPQLCVERGRQLGCRWRRVGTSALAHPNCNMRPGPCRTRPLL